MEKSKTRSHSYRRTHGKNQSQKTLTPYYLSVKSSKSPSLYSARLKSKSKSKSNSKSKSKSKSKTKKQLSNLISKNEFHTYMQSVEKNIVKRINDIEKSMLTKTDLHNYMSAIEKRILNGIQNGVTQSDLHNYMSTVEKKLLRAIKDNSCDCNNITKNEIKQMLTTLNTVHLANTRGPSKSKELSLTSSLSKSSSLTKCGRGKRCPPGKHCKSKKCIRKL